MTDTTTTQDDNEKKQAGDRPLTTKELIQKHMDEEKMETKKINQYALYETSSRSFHSNLASKNHAEPGIMFEIDGEIKRPIDIVAGPTKPGSSWDSMLEAGIRSKTTRSSGNAYGRGRTRTDKRYKIPRKAAEEHEIKVIIFESKTGGNINPGTDYRKFEILSIEKLEVQG